MLKLIVMVVCDTCGESFEPVAISCDRDPKAWYYLAADLEMSAESSGWHHYAATHRLACDDKHICSDCELDEAEDLQSGM
jgi:hypothetical protein